MRKNVREMDFIYALWWACRRGFVAGGVVDCGCCLCVSPGNDVAPYGVRAERAI